MASSVSTVQKCIWVLSIAVDGHAVMHDDAFVMFFLTAHVLVTSLLQFAATAPIATEDVEETSVTSSFIADAACTPCHNANRITFMTMFWAWIANYSFSACFQPYWTFTAPIKRQVHIMIAATMSDSGVNRKVVTFRQCILHRFECRLLTNSFEHATADHVTKTL